MTELAPLPGFDWMLVNWSGPDELVPDICCYCEAPIGEDEVPLRMSREDGWSAAFCEACMQRCWGFSPAPREAGDFDDPELP